MVALPPPMPAYQPRSFAEYGGGWIDYSDIDTQNNVTTPLPDGIDTPIARNLVASAANTRLNMPFAGWQPWDNAAKLFRGRALNDILCITIDIRVIPDRIDTVLRVALMAGTLEVRGLEFPITTIPGTEQKISAQFTSLAVRNMFKNNGAAIVLTPTGGALTLVECSPEIYPMGYEP